MIISVPSKIFIILRGVIYASAFVSLWGWLALSVRSLDQRMPFHIPAWLSPVGFVLAAAGALLALYCIAVFLTQGRGTPAPFDPPRDLVVTGPYRYVRNPMYVGGIAVLLGAGLALRSVGIVVLAFVAFTISHLFVVLYEEPALERMFGNSYARYRASVSRWFLSKPKPADFQDVG